MRGEKKEEGKEIYNWVISIVLDYQWVFNFIIESNDKGWWSGER